MLDYTVGPISKQNDSLETLELYDLWNELSAADELLSRGNRIAIPSTMRKENIECIHDENLSITKYREWESQGVYWPRISKNLQDQIKTVLRRVKHYQIETLLPPTRPIILISASSTNLPPALTSTK